MEREGAYVPHGSIVTQGEALGSIWVIFLVLSKPWSFGTVFEGLQNRSRSAWPSI